MTGVEHRAFSESVSCLKAALCHLVSLSFAGFASGAAYPLPIPVHMELSTSPACCVQLHPVDMAGKTIPHNKVHVIPMSSLFGPYKCRLSNCVALAIVTPIPSFGRTCPFHAHMPPLRHTRAFLLGPLCGMHKLPSSEWQLNHLRCTCRQAFNMGMCAARLVFLLTSLDGGHDDWEAQYVVLALSALSVVLQTSCFEHLRSSAPREKRIFLASAVNRADVSARWVGMPSWRETWNQPSAYESPQSRGQYNTDDYRVSGLYADMSSLSIIQAAGPDDAWQWECRRLVHGALRRTPGQTRRKYCVNLYL